jgi:hypothetical protein
MLGYKFRDSFFFLRERWISERLRDIALISLEKLLRHTRELVPNAFTLTHHRIPSLNGVHPSKRLKPLVKPTPVQTLRLTPFYHPKSYSLWLKRAFRFAKARLYCVLFSDSEASVFASSNRFPNPSESISRPSTASHQTTERPKMIFSRQKPEKTMRLLKDSV